MCRRKLDRVKALGEPTNFGVWVDESAATGYDLAKLPPTPVASTPHPVEITSIPLTKAVPNPLSVP